MNKLTGNIHTGVMLLIVNALVDHLQRVSTLLKLCRISYMRRYTPLEARKAIAASSQKRTRTAELSQEPVWVTPY